MEFTYKPKGVCSKLMELDIEYGKIQSLKVTGGCSGNLQGIARLVAGMDIDEAISRMEASAADTRALHVRISLRRRSRHTRYPRPDRL